MKNIITTIMVSLMTSALAIGIYHYYTGLHGQDKPEDQRYTQVVEDSFLVRANDTSPRFVAEGVTTVPTDFHIAAERAMPAVVHIKSIRTVTRRAYDPFYEFFGGRPRQENSRRNVSSGSGVIISSDGYIVTNNHVIKDADELEVTLYDNRTYKATVIGTDPSTDLGLIKVNETNLPIVQLANSDDTRVGEWVLAVGNPFSLASTATAGIVSAIGRDLEIIKDQMAIESFIQTDAAVNPGNSGGALVNLEGRLLGVNTAIASPTGTYAGYAFAVPANIVEKVISDLKAYGSVQRAFIGIHYAQSLDGELAAQKGLKITEGVYVEEVAEIGGAAKAGIRPGDVIVSIEGIKIKNDAKLLELVGRNRPGDIIDVKVYRNGTYKSFKVQLSNRDGSTTIQAGTRNKLFTELGVDLRPLTDRELSRLGVERGVLVEKMYAGTIRRDTDMKENFVILEVDDKAVSTVDDFVSYIEGARGKIVLTGFYPGYNRLFSYEVEWE